MAFTGDNLKDQLIATLRDDVWPRVSARIQQLADRDGTSPLDFAQKLSHVKRVFEMLSNPSENSNEIRAELNRLRKEQPIQYLRSLHHSDVYLVGSENVRAGHNAPDDDLWDIINNNQDKDFRLRS